MARADFSVHRAFPIKQCYYRIRKFVEKKNSHKSQKIFTVIKRPRPLYRHSMLYIECEQWRLPHLMVLFGGSNAFYVCKPQFFSIFRYEFGREAVPTPFFIAFSLKIWCGFFYDFYCMDVGIPFLKMAYIEFGFRLYHIHFWRDSRSIVTEKLHKTSRNNYA